MDQMVKNLQCGRPGSIPRSGRSPGEGNGNPLQYSCLENSMDRGACQATYSPWGRKELGTTEQLAHTHTHTHTYVLLQLSYTKQLFC